MDDDERKDKKRPRVTTIKCLPSGKHKHRTYPSSVLVCLCFPDEDIKQNVLWKLLVVSCLFVRRRPLVSKFFLVLFHSIPLVALCICVYV